jgi:2-phosphosulfolactate phosphatase
MSNGTFVIDCFPESAARYRGDHAVVAVDVIRATTTAVTAAHLGHQVHPVASLDEVAALAGQLNNALLVGELGGNMPFGFDFTNSPVEVERGAHDRKRPIVLISSSGTQLVQNARGAPAVHLACLRNFTFTAEYLSRRYPRIALLGAGTRNEFREEDQLCCSWMGRRLLELGYTARDQKTLDLVTRWRDAPVEACAQGKSAAYLRDSGQLRDLDYILAHVDDLRAVCRLDDAGIAQIMPAELVAG